MVHPIVQWSVATAADAGSDVRSSAGPDSGQLAGGDYSQRFYFPKLAARGVIVRLQKSWQELTAQRNYPLPIQHLLGELALAAVMLAAQSKEKCRFNLQLQCVDPIELLTLECNSDLQLRGVVKLSQTESNTPFNDKLTVSQLLKQLASAQAQFVLSVDYPDSDQPRYQSFVPIEGEDSTSIFANFIARSEQQPSVVKFAHNDTQLVGIFLQKMPEQSALVNANADVNADDANADVTEEVDSDAWNRLAQFTATVRPEELLHWDNDKLLSSLYHYDLQRDHAAIRLLPFCPVCYYAPRDEAKIARLLLRLGADECQNILQAEGVIHIHDDIGNHHYYFDAAAVAQIFT